MVHHQIFEHYELSHQPKLKLPHQIFNKEKTQKTQKILKILKIQRIFLKKVCIYNLYVYLLLLTYFCISNLYKTEEPSVNATHTAAPSSIGVIYEDIQMDLDEKIDPDESNNNQLIPNPS